MDTVTLSICMATRNRGAFIGATLESIVRQANEHVEIVVLDGASTDNTEDVIRQYQERFPRLRYFRQETNRGIDQDFAKAVDLASGDYCWLFCDDDLLKAGAIQAVLEAIKNHHALIIANSEVRSADLSKLLEPRRMPLTKDAVYESSDSHLLFSDTLDYLSFIGGVIIKRQVWTSRKKEKYFGSYFIHVGIIFQEALNGSALAIAEPLISIRYANASWLGKYFEIWMFKWPELVWSFTGFPDAVKSRVCPREPWRNLKTLLHFRAKGAYTRKEYTELIEPRLGSFWARLLSQACARVPGRVANLLVFLNYSIFRHKAYRLLYLSDLANSPFCFWKLPVRLRGTSRADSVSSGAQLSPGVAPASRIGNQ
jgi:abequosyltransferase